MACKRGTPATTKARGGLEFDQLGGQVDWENSLPPSLLQVRFLVARFALAEAIARTVSLQGGVMSGARHRRKGDRIERELIALHRELGIHAEMLAAEKEKHSEAIVEQGEQGRSRS